VNTIKRCLFLAGCSVFSTLLLVAAPALAEDPDPATAPVAADEIDHLSGNLILNVDTNFMSYGFDVWQTGNFDDGLFHPQFDLKWDFGNGFNVFSGVWMDVNSNADSSISDDVQEVDVWLGVGYTYEKLSVSLTYQEWMYAFDSERIVDLGIAYDTFLSPSLTLDLGDLIGIQLGMSDEQLLAGQCLRVTHLAAAVSRAFSQSALNWTMPLSVRGWWTICWMTLNGRVAMWAPASAAWV